MKIQIDCIKKKKDQNKTEGCIPRFKKPAISNQPFGIIKGYGINSFTGFYKKHNEDRVYVIQNISKPRSSTKVWPNHLSYFGLFDGHSGNQCCDFLIKNCHKFLIKSSYFPKNMEKALKDAIEKSEAEFLSTIALSPNNELLTKSGSCALIVIIADDICYIANVGDSRAILSSQKGKQVYQLTHDHKPNAKKEKKRIKENGGIVYKAGPLIYRCLPGDLSVSRTIGDADVKIPFLGGKEGVVVATPEIMKFKIDEDNYDFLLIGCDGIFDKSDNVEIVDSIWNEMEKDLADNINEQCGRSADNAIKLAMNNKSTDNLSTIFISFPSFEKAFLNRKKENY